MEYKRPNFTYPRCIEDAISSETDFAASGFHQTLYLSLSSRQRKTETRTKTLALCIYIHSMMLLDEKSFGVSYVCSILFLFSPSSDQLGSLNRLFSTCPDNRACQQPHTHTTRHIPPSRPLTPPSSPHCLVHGPKNPCILSACK